MKERVLTEEVFDEIVEKMNKEYERGLDWNSFHPAVAPWTVRKLEKEFPNNCPFCGLTWKKCQEWRQKNNANSSSTGDFSFDNLDF